MANDLPPGFRVVSRPKDDLPEGFRVIPSRGGLDPSVLPDRNPPMSFREGLRGTVGEMLHGIPVVGQALLEGGQKLGALKRSFLDDIPYEEALERGHAQQDAFRRENPKVAASGQTAGASAAFAGLGAAFPRAMGTVGPNALARVTAGGLSGAGIGAADAAVRGQSPAIGATVGGAAGAAGPLALRAVTPLPISPERRALVDALRNEGVHPTAGQVTGRDKLRYFESEIGGGATQRRLSEIDDQFTRATLRRVGENADRATPDVMDRAFTRIGGEFDRLAQRSRITVDPQLVNDMRTAWRDYADLVPESQRAPAVMAFIEDIGRRVNPNQLGRGAPVIQGEEYQAFRSRLDRLARQSRTDPQLSEAFSGIRNALDDAVERGMSQADRDAWRTARRQYRDMIVLERASVGAGENAAMGAISPARLRQAATTGRDRRQYVRGRGDFSELARAGQAVMTPLPQSGTAPRMATRGIMGVPAVLGGLAGGSVGGAMETGAGLMAGAAVPFLAGRAVMSRPVQAYLSNQLLATGGAGGLGMRDEIRRAVARALLQGPAASARQNYAP